MKFLMVFMVFSVFAQDKIALPQDFGTWDGENPFSKLGRCEMQCGGDGCIVVCE